MRAIQARSSSAERTLASESIGCGWVTFSSFEIGVAADPLRRRVGREQLGVLGLERAQLVEQRVVGVVADLGVVEDVVAVAVVLELAAQLGDALRGAHSTSRAAGASSRARSYACSVSMPGTSVRSKWIGVTATRPSATAARSVPSWRS